MGWEEMAAAMLPFPTSIPVDNNDPKSLALFVDVVDSRTLVAPEFASLIGGDTSLSTLRSGRFRPASEDRRRSYRKGRDRFKKSINDKTSVMGPAFPNENRNPNKWETQRNSLRSSFVFQFVKTVLFILTILGGVECIRN